MWHRGCLKVQYVYNDNQVDAINDLSMLHGAMH